MYRNALNQQKGGNNFTFIRNAEIQKLTKELVHHYRDKIHEGLTNANLRDDIYDDGKWSNGRAWLSKRDRDIHLARYDTVWLPKEEWKSAVLVVHPEATRDKIIAATRQEIADTSVDEVIVVGFRHATLEKAMDTFHSEKLRWWNLQEKESQSVKAARNYGVIMLALDKRSPKIVEVQ